MAQKYRRPRQTIINGGIQLTEEDIDARERRKRAATAALRMFRLKKSPVR